MLLDKLTELADGQVITADALSTNVIDLQVAGYHGLGNPLYFCIAASAIDSSSGNEVYSIRLEEADGVDGSGNLSAGRVAVVGTSIGIPRTPASSFRWITVPGAENLKRYVGAYVDVGGTTPSITITAWLTYIRPGNEAVTKYADRLDLSTI